MTTEPFDLRQLTIEQASSALRAGVVSPVDLVETALARIEAVEPGVNAFVRVLAESARSSAATAKLEMDAGHFRGPLHGIPMAVKDLFDVVGTPTTASSKVRADYFPLTDAHVVALLQRGGAIAIGKAHTHEFAYGGVTPQSHNPWDRSRITGGSSGGSAAAVASGEALFALGTDTAGSIRIPSSCCGVVGIKPTYGRVSTHGVTPLSPTLDHVGPLARTVRDAAIVLQIMAGYDAQDPTSSPEPVPDYLRDIEAGAAGLRVGIPENFFYDHCSDAVVTGVQDLAKLLEAQGAQLVSFNVRDADKYADVEFCIAMAESSAYHEEMLRKRGPLYLDDTRAKLEMGQSILATEYLHALKVKKEFTSAWRREFLNFDVALTPTLPNVAPRADEEVVLWSDGYSESIDTNVTRLNCPHNLTGQPVLSMRCGFENGLPFGVSFSARAFDEATVFRAARTSEKLLGSWSEGPFPSSYEGG